MKKTIKTVEESTKEIYTIPKSNSELGRRKLCRCYQINRDLEDIEHINTLVEILKDYGWLNENHAFIFPAEMVNDIEKNPDLKFTDLEGKEILEENLKEYYLVVDGQNRLKALKILNYILEQEGKDGVYEIPSEVITLRDENTVSKYIANFNSGKSWGIGQYIKTSRSIHKDPILIRYNNYLSDKKIPGKFTCSTLNLIYYSSKNIINKQKAEKIMKGNKLPKNYNLERGDRFIKLCLEKFGSIYTGGRYLIECFYALRNKLDNDQDTFKVFESLQMGDISKMIKSIDKPILNEQKIYETINQVRIRENIRPDLRFDLTI